MLLLNNRLHAQGIAQHVMCAHYKNTKEKTKGTATDFMEGVELPSWTQNFTSQQARMWNEGKESQEDLK